MCYSRPKVYNVMPNFIWMCSLCRLPVAKNHNQFLGKFWTHVPTPFYRWGSKVVWYSRPTVYAYVPNFVSIGLFCRPLLPKNPNFCRFWTSAFRVVASWQQSHKVVEHGCTTTNLALSTASKSLLYSNAFMAKSGAQSLTFKNVHDEQTDRQTLNVFGHPGGGLQPSPTKLGRVIEDLFLFIHCP